MTSAGMQFFPYGEWLLGAAILFPLALVLAVFPRTLRPAAMIFAPWAALPGLALAFLRDFNIELPWLMLNSRLGLDGTGRLFLTFTALLWLIAGLYARSYLSADPRRHRFTAFFLSTLTGNLGLILAQDVASFYLFFALMTFSAYGLIVHEDSEAARRAGRIYLILAVFGEILLSVAFLLAASAAESLWLDTLPSAIAASPWRDMTVALLLAGFGVKVGVLLLHVWLPLAHPVAPTPASAVLSGVILKAGLLGWLRFLPLGEAALAGWGYACVAAGLLAAIYAAAAGVAQNDAKTVLAYSSVSQMGLITVPVGLALALPALWPSIRTAILLYTVHHALTKSALFLGVGVARSSGGEPRCLRWIVAGLLLPSLALAGAPFTSGALAKQALKDIAVSLGSWHAGFEWALSATAVGTTLLLARFLYLAWHEGLRESHGSLKRALFFVWVSELLCVPTLPWILFPEMTAAFLTHVLEPSVLWGETWPLLSGMLLAFLFGFLFRLSIPAIPPGDLLVPVERLALALKRVWKEQGVFAPARPQRILQHVRFLQIIEEKVSGMLATRQPAQDSLSIAGVFLLSLVLLFIFALSSGNGGT